MFFQKNEQELAEIMNNINTLKLKFQLIFQKSMDPETQIVSHENLALIVSEMV